MPAGIRFDIMNGVIIIDKPCDWTSHDVIGKLRGLLHERRIGHGGTLDPMATGVLPVFVGRATRAVEFCENAEKEYIAGLRLGVVTDTQDITGSVLEEHSADISEEELRRALGEFTGSIMQLPPMYSAVKVGGKKLYQLARRGIEIERKPRQITVSKIEIQDKTENGYILRIVCSKGTYVRTLCHDIGRALRCGGCMDSLRRVRAGSFGIENAVTIEDVQAASLAGEAEKLLMPVDSLFAEYESLAVNDIGEKKCRCGTDSKAPSGTPDGEYRVYSESGEFLMLGRVRSGILSTVKSFFEV